MKQKIMQAVFTKSLFKKTIYLNNQTKFSSFQIVKLNSILKTKRKKIN